MPVPIEFHVSSQQEEAHGFGVADKALVNALTALGCDVRKHVADELPWTEYQKILPVEEVEASPRERDIIRICRNAAPLFDWGNARWRVGFTMWESSRLPTDVPVVRNRYAFHLRERKRRRQKKAGSASVQFRELAKLLRGLGVEVDVDFIEKHVPNARAAMELMRMAGALGMKVPAEMVPDQVFLVSWADYCNTADLVMVPTPWLVEVFSNDLRLRELTKLLRGAGVELNEEIERDTPPAEAVTELTGMADALGLKLPVGAVAPVVEVPLGIDPERWRPLDRSDHDGRPFAFLQHGALDYRKGIELTYEAFYQEFAPEEVQVLARQGLLEDAGVIWQAQARREGVDPILVLKTRMMDLYEDWKVHGANRPYRFSDPNVKLLRGNWSWAGLMELMARADAYVFPSRGEGWGFTPLEAAATGLLPIVPRAHAFSRPGVEDWALLVDEGRPVKAHFRVWSRAGEFWEMDVGALRRAMRWCYENPSEVRRRGLEASRVVRERYTWEKAAERLVAALCERFGFERKELVA